MKYLISITQDPEQIINSMSKGFNGSAISSEVGPFESATDASKWMKFMTTRAEDFETRESPSESLDDTPWYGVTVQGKSS